MNTIRKQIVAADVENGVTVGILYHGILDGKVVHEVKLTLEQALIEADGFHGLYLDNKKVITKKKPNSNEKYLTTTADENQSNNIDNLPSLSDYYAAHAADLQTQVYLLRKTFSEFVEILKEGRAASNKTVTNSLDGKTLPVQLTATPNSGPGPLPVDKPKPKK